jgi:hypothetical protein
MASPAVAPRRSAVVLGGWRRACAPEGGAAGPSGSSRPRLRAPAAGGPCLAKARVVPSPALGCAPGEAGRPRTSCQLPAAQREACGAAAAQPDMRTQQRRTHVAQDDAAGAGLHRGRQDVQPLKVRQDARRHEQRDRACGRGTVGGRRGRAADWRPCCLAPGRLRPRHARHAARPAGRAGRSTQGRRSAASAPVPAALMCCAAREAGVMMSCCAQGMPQPCSCCAMAAEASGKAAAGRSGRCSWAAGAGGGRGGGGLAAPAGAHTSRRLGGRVGDEEHRHALRPERRDGLRCAGDRLRAGGGRWAAGWGPTRSRWAAGGAGSWLAGPRSAGGGDAGGTDLALQLQDAVDVAQQAPPRGGADGAVGGPRLGRGGAAGDRARAALVPPHIATWCCTHCDRQRGERGDRAAHAATAWCARRQNNLGVARAAHARSLCGACLLLGFRSAGAGGFFCLWPAA